MRRALPVTLFLGLGAAGAGVGQLSPAGTGGVQALASDLATLGAAKRVLMIGAHPDDEDTELLVFLSRGLGAQAAYLSLTRGEGGQNVIGPELGPELGIIRTEELLAARRLDGARQYFTRAYDFGFSKTLEESLRFWPRDSLLQDVLAVIRAFRPQVIVSVFSGTPRDGHGQHQVAGLLARAAFAILKDSSWGPVKLYQSARFDTGATTLTLEGGRLDPLTGQSFHQLAMAGRSRHRSQEMGQLERSGPSPIRLTLLETREPRAGDTDGFFAGVDTVLHGRARYVALIDSARQALNPFQPGAIVPWLVRARAALGPDLADQQALLERALAEAAGVSIDGTADDAIVVGGERLNVEASVWNAGSATVRLEDVRLVAPSGWVVEPLDHGTGPVGLGAVATWRFAVTVPADAPRSTPYFLRRPLAGALYDWSQVPSDVRGLPFEPPLLRVEARLSVNGAPVVLTREVSERHRDPVDGEVRRPVLVDCAFDVAVTPALVVWPLDGPAASARSFTVTVTNRTRGAATAQVVTTAPSGWTEPPPARLSFDKEDETQSITATLTLPSGVRPGAVRLGAVAVGSDGRRCEGALGIIDYPHIHPRPVDRPGAGAGAGAADVHVARIALPALARVGYVRGAADRVPEALAAVGVPVSVLGPDSLAHGDLSRFDAIVVGSRAYEIDQALVAHNARLVDYARAGGLVIVQYQQYPFVQGRFAPYPFSIARPHDRVTDETAPITALVPSSPVFHVPNEIGPADWDGWVQERGLYFAHDWDTRYTPLVATHDPGEAPLSGGLLVARVGKGTYVYTGLSFFRQLPAGVPGAYRLFANLLALGK